MNNLNSLLSFSKHRCKTLVLFAVLSAASGPALAAVVVLNLLNTEALTDSSLVPLLGNSSSGDLVQLFTLGVDGLIDIPDPATGAVSDDVLFGISNNPTHVGVGTIGAGNDSGILLQVNLQFDDSFVGSNVYVRFWDASTIASASGYGDTATLIIPTLTFGEATLDFAPTGTGPYITSNAFFFGAVPEPSSAILILSAGLVFLFRTNFRKWAVHPLHVAGANGRVVKG